METDPRIDQILEITKDTNRMVHKMRRSMMWGRFFYVLVWLIMVLGPVVAYYVYFQSYVQPYMDKIQQFEQQLQQANKTTQSYQNQISNFFGNLRQQQGTATTSGSATVAH